MSIQPCAPTQQPTPRAKVPHFTAVLLAAMLGISAALLVACGGSSGKLIPVANAGPLQTDFEAIAQEAEAGDGSCSATEAAIAKTEQDFSALPGTLDAGLRATLRQGIENLRSRALVLCHQPLAQTSTSGTPTRSTRTTTSTPTQTQQTTTTSTTPTTPAETNTTPTPEGGTPAPGAGEAEQQQAPSGPGGGTGAGEGNGASGEAGGGASPPKEEGPPGRALGHEKNHGANGEAGT